MHKLFINFFASGSVLVAGLVSCSKETKSTDVYRTKPPLIRSGQSSQDLKAWNLLKNKEFDLQDILDFSESNPAKIEMSSNCHSGKDNFYGNATFTRNPRVQIWQVLPPEALTEILDEKIFSCGFTLNLYNDVGSNHIFHIDPAPVVEHLAAGVRIGVDGIAAMPTRLTPAEMPNVRIRYGNKSPSAVKLICQNMELNSLPFEQVVELVHFDFSQPLASPGRDPSGLTAHPVQNCRAVILQNGLPSALSNLVRITLPQPPLVLAPPPPQVPGPLGIRGAMLIHSIMHAESSVLLDTFAFTNPSKVIRYFRIPKRKHALTAQIFVPTQPNGNDFRSAEIRLAAYTVTPIAGNKFSETAESVTISVGPGAALQLEAVFRAKSSAEILARTTPESLNFQNFEPVTVTEVAEDGAEIFPFPVVPRPYHLASREPGKNISILGTFDGGYWD